MKNNSVYSVYWIKPKRKCYVREDGYVGISNNPKRRISEHLKNYRLKKFLKGGYELVILAKNLSEKEALILEEKLRPSENIGWNIVRGGGKPPINNNKRPEHSENMRGSGNPFYGKKHSKETIQILKEKMSGENSHFYGKKRSEHSKKMKEKKGENYPKFRGYFVTPLGKFESFKKASECLKISPTTLYNICEKNNKEKITKSMFNKLKGILKLTEKDLYKTYKGLGFGYDYK